MPAGYVAGAGVVLVQHDLDADRVARPTPGRYTPAIAVRDPSRRRRTPKRNPAQAPWTVVVADGSTRWRPSGPENGRSASIRKRLLVLRQTLLRSASAASSASLFSASISLLPQLGIFLEYSGSAFPAAPGAGSRLRTRPARSACSRLSCSARVSAGRGRSTPRSRAAIGRRRRPRVTSSSASTHGAGDLRRSGCGSGYCADVEPFRPEPWRSLKAASAGKPDQRRKQIRTRRSEALPCSALTVSSSPDPGMTRFT